MTRLEELIKELCPNGVEYKRFDEACTLNARIGWQRLTKAEYKTTGNYMLITGTDFTTSYTINYDSCVYVSEDRYSQDSKIQIKNGDVLITKDGTLGKVAQVNFLPMPATLNGGVFVVRPKDNSLLPRYIMHFLLSDHFQKVVDQQKTGSTISHLTQALFSRLQIPVPPLPVQEEIVRILDSFTELTANLTAEITARKKQYEYYRDKLLTASDFVIKKIALSDLFLTRNGYTPSTSNQEFWNSNDVPWFRMEDIRENGRVLSDAIQHVSKKAVKGNPFPPNSIIVATSATIGEHALITCESLANQRFTYLMLRNEYKEKYNIKFLFYYCYLLDEYCKANLNQGNFASVDMKQFAKFEFPLLPLSIQNKIVQVLDNFDSICSDLKIGLPAEIEARTKQYEYYRDKLLSFKETPTYEQKKEVSKTE